jgi:hypothetical protein
MQPWQRGRKFSTGRLAFDAHDRLGRGRPSAGLGYKNRDSRPK